MSAIQFGLNIPTSAGGGADPVAAAVRAEELGFDFISCSDHPAGINPTYETWTMLCFIAAATSRIRIATRVLGVPYRAPAMVAKMAETLDRLSAGRLILGLGSGSADDEHRAFGLGVRSPRDKTDGLEEAVTVIRGLWSERSFTFAGRLYQTEAADLEPKPAHLIPIWLGTFAPRALAVTGRYADGWIPSLGYATADEVVVMRERVLTAARQAGRDPAAITCAYNIEVPSGRARRGPGSGRRRSARGGGEPVAELRRAGLLSVQFHAQRFDSQEQAARLAGEVIPVLRAA